MTGTLREIVAQAKREAIRDALIATDGNRTQAARRLGINRTHLQALLRNLLRERAARMLNGAPGS